MKLSRDEIYHMKMGDYIIIAAVLLIAAIAVIFIFHQNNGDEVIITDNDKTSSYSLKENREIEIRSASGDYNIVIIKDNRVWVEKASCKNQICVHHSAISKNGESIICVPNGVTITINGTSDNDIDN